MYKKRFNRQTALRFRQFTRTGYALFCALGKEVIICTLSATTLTYAKADGISVEEPLATDSLGRQEVKLDEVVVTGSRAPLTAIQSAKIVTVITRDDIERAAAESVNDVLKVATGVDVRQRGGFGVQTDISINGGTFDQITILLNGMNISSPQTGHIAADFPVALSDIERIEVLEGASARILGSSAFSGALNIVTRKNDRNHATLTTQGGSFGTAGIESRAVAGNRHFNNSLSTGYSRSDGGTKNSDFAKHRIYYHGLWSTRNVNVEWQTGLSSQTFGANTFYSAKFNNQYEETCRYIASVHADIATDKKRKFVIAPSVYWHKDYDHYQLTRGKEGAAEGENFHKTDVYGAGFNTYIWWKLGKTAIGADVRKEHLSSTAYGEKLPENEWSGINGSTRRYDHRGERTNTGIFIEHNIILKKITISAGLLANRNTGLDRSYRVLPGIDISYRPSSKWKIYVSWNKALRIPTFTDLYTDNAVQKGDINLKAERNSTFKTGVSYKCTGLEATACAFASNGRNMIDWVYETEESKKYHAMNIGKIDNCGLSADLTAYIYKIMHNPIVRKIKIGYSYLNQQHETAHEIHRSLYALEYLRHKLTAQVDHRIWKLLTARWQLRWQQRMNGYHPYAKLDMKITWSGQNYDLFVKADNLTAHRYYDFGGIRQPGLWIMAGASVKIGW